MRVWATSTGAPANGAPDVALTANGTFAVPYIGGDGFDYRLNTSAANPGSVTVTSTGGGTDTQSIPYRALPVAVDDNYKVGFSGTLTVAAAGLLANDSRGGYFNAPQLFVAELVAGPDAGTLTCPTTLAPGICSDGSFEYTGDGVRGLVTFTYKARANAQAGPAGQRLSNEATVSIMVLR